MKFLWLPCQELQATVNSEATNMVLMTFFKTTCMSKPRDTRVTLDEQHGGILWFYYAFFFFFHLIKRRGGVISSGLSHPILVPVSLSPPCCCHTSERTRMKLSVLLQAEHSGEEMKPAVLPYLDHSISLSAQVCSVSQIRSGRDFVLITPCEIMQCAYCHPQHCVLW